MSPCCQGGMSSSSSSSDRLLRQTKRLVYLDSAATSHKPTAVTNAPTQYYKQSNSNVHQGAHALSRVSTNAYEGARDKVASFVNAYSWNEIVFTSGATDAINLVATSLSYTSGEEEQQYVIAGGDEILITKAENHSNIVPWQMVADRMGAVLRYVPAASFVGPGGWTLPHLQVL